MKIRVNKRLATLLLTGLVLSGCGNQTKKEIIEPIKEENVTYTDDGIKIIHVEEKKEKAEIKKDKDDCVVVIYGDKELEEIIGFAIKKPSIEVITVAGDYAYIKSDNLKGYAKVSNLLEEGIDINNQTLLNNYSFNEIYKTTEAVNLRESSSLDSNIITTLPGSITVEFLGLRIDGWYKVNYNGNIGFIHPDYIKKVKELRLPIEPIKYVYPLTNTVIYDDHNLTEITDESIKSYEFAKVYAEDDKSYLIVTDNTIGYIDKNVCEELNNTFVIIDISDQELSLYRDNELILTTPVVTGKNSTPTDIGCHKIFKIRRNTILQDEARTYASYVDYMLNFNYGEGLHDAEYITHTHEDGTTKSHGWRNITEFGGETYQYSGSHGCVNMPYESVKSLYEEVIDELKCNFPDINITNYMELPKEQQIIKVLVKE